MKLTFLGTGDAMRVPVYGCACRACSRALLESQYRRGACSISLSWEDEVLLVDAGQRDLTERFAPGTLTAILLTHYHMDHVAGLFELRWGVGCRIPVFGPDDPRGCDDLFKHPGILDFKPPLKAFTPFRIGSVKIHPVTLNHSKPCLGFCFEINHVRIAYLTDTVGLSTQTTEYLASLSLDWLIVDCTHPPTTCSQSTSANHNHWPDVLVIREALRPTKTLLTHVSHEMDLWLLDHALPADVSVAYDGLVIHIKD